MVKRKYSKMSKIQPSVQTLTFAYSVESGAQNNYIDLSQVASLVNRRFYRQGINWAVSGFKFLLGATAPPSGAPYSLNVRKLPNTWVMSNSWEKVFRAWKRQQDETLEDGTQESVRAKFNDFKIFMDDDHHSSTFASNLLPVGFTAGEWEASQIVIPNYGAPGVNYEPYLMGVGSDVSGTGGAISMIEAYANSRSVPQSPDPSVPAGILNTSNHLRAMFDVGDNNEDILENVVNKNNDLPYPQDDYPGGSTEGGVELHDSEYYTDTTISSTIRMPGGNFPCGLIKLEHFGFDATPVKPINVLLQVNLVPGSHRGYLCEPMTEM